MDQGLTEMTGFVKVGRDASPLAPASSPLNRRMAHCANDSMQQTAQASPLSSERSAGVALPHPSTNRLSIRLTP